MSGGNCQGGWERMNPESGRGAELFGDYLDATKINFNNLMQTRSVPLAHLSIWKTNDEYALNHK